MPEVLKSLLEHTLPWPEKRAGRSTGDLIGKLPRCPRGGGRHGDSNRQAREVSQQGSVLGAVLSRGRVAVQRTTQGNMWVPHQLWGCPLGLLALGSYGQCAASDRCNAHVEQGQDKSAC
jgi:hypothetical protein